MAFVQTVDGLEVVRPNWSPGPVRRAIQFYDRFNYDYATIYRTQPNVRTCVDFLARNIAQLGLHTFKRIDETDRVRLRDHGLPRLLDRPLPPEMKVTRYRLIESLMSDLGIYFNAYWLKLRAGEHLGLLRLPPPDVEPIGGLLPQVYRITIGGRQKDFGPGDVVHFKGYNPENPLVGLPPLETLRRVLAEEHEAGNYRQYFWRNSARMAGVIKRPLAAPSWSETARNRFIAEFEELYSEEDNSGKTAVLEEGMEWEKTSFSAQESEYLAGRKLTREECARAYHIPLPLVGILDHATFSNIQEQHKHLYQDSLGPWLASIEQDIELQLLPEFEDSEGVYVEFNIAEKLAGSFEEQSKSFQAAVGRPYMTANEARARMNLPRLDGDADQLVTPLNVIVGGQASPQDSTPETRGLGAGEQGRKLLPVLHFKQTQTGAMIALMLPPDAAKMLEFTAQMLLPGVEVEPADELHITLAYLGDTESLTINWQSVAPVLSKFAAEWGPMMGVINGVGLFNKVQEDGTMPFYALYDSPRLPAFRQALVEMLAEAGVAMGSQHGFVPHITLAYIPHDMTLPAIELPRTSVVFTAITLAWAGDRRDFPLLGAKSGRVFARKRFDSYAPQLRERHRQKWVEVLTRHYKRQEAAIVSRVPKSLTPLTPALSQGEREQKVDIGVWWDSERWNSELKADLLRLNVLTAMAWAELIGEQAGIEVSEDRMLPWLDEHSRVMAESMNLQTQTAVQAALQESDPLQAVKDVFVAAVAVWALRQAIGAVTSASSFGANEAARAGGLSRKTWHVNSSNPRDSHKAMNGMTIPIGALFPTGQKWPGDPAGGADENANCECSVSFS